MRLKRFLSEKDSVMDENKLLKFAVCVIGAGLLVNGFFTQKAINQVRTIIVPPVVNEKFEIKGSEVSPEYLRVMTRYALGLALNYTASNARNQFTELLTLYSPAAYNEAKRIFLELADTIEATKLVNTFEIHKMNLEKDKQTIEAVGVTRQLFSMQGKTDKDGQETYVIEYSVHDGRFRIEKIYKKKV